MENYQEVILIFVKFGDEEEFSFRHKLNDIHIVDELEERNYFLMTNRQEETLINNIRKDIDKGKRSNKKEYSKHGKKLKIRWVLTNYTEI